MLKLPSNYVETAGYKTHYVEAGSGPLLILIHGGGAGADGLGNWQQCFPYYTPYFHTVAYDMVGFGKSDSPDVETFPYDKDARTAQAIALIEALGEGPAYLVGNSMGSVAALGVAMQRPDLVSKLVLMGSAGINRKVPPAIAASANYDFSLEAMRNVMRVLTRPEFVIDEELVRYRYELLVDNPEKRKSFLRTVQVVIDSGGIYYEDEEISSIKTPTLIFHGRDDKVIPLSDAIRTMELMEEAHAHFVPHCGHWAMMEQPETFGRVTAEWLRAN
ncbi:pimeloyl-ACP methyl ester carboxylesterase [Sphingomonas vulcanisoli]|uniref:Pimeloyl-ACP methyl ester carboxylesterase n=1 Tax=Sphingomonas vulcanisoli TaxID=1658060 RepID=A0ABX0TZ20_9SPHN|nr:alpha/beta hydrolase [Sphingomonas vulcanisoli]NIJ09615.1 pimeloyl-ACP methyl ester carboxylesterase [Sphingomonas vulcanisoli]